MTSSVGIRILKNKTKTLKFEDRLFFSFEPTSQQQLPLVNNTVQYHGRTAVFQVPAHPAHGRI